MFRRAQMWIWLKFTFAINRKRAVFELSANGALHAAEVSIDFGETAPATTSVIPFLCRTRCNKVSTLFSSDQIRNLSWMNFRTDARRIYRKSRYGRIVNPNLTPSGRWNLVFLIGFFEAGTFTVVFRMNIHDKIQFRPDFLYLSSQITDEDLHQHFYDR